MSNTIVIRDTNTDSYKQPHHSGQSLLRSAWTVAKLNLRNDKGAYLTAGIVEAVGVVDYVLSVIQAATGMDMAQQASVSLGWYLWLFPVLAAVFIPLRNFNRIISLGGKRRNYFWGSALTYVVLAFMTTLISTVFFYALDDPLGRSGFIGPIWSPQDILGWGSNGPVVAFIQQFVFLLMFMAFVHTLLSAQSAWYGWVSDIIIVAIISTFTSIAFLRGALVWFLNLIIFGNPVWQIISCLVLAVVFYAPSKPVITRKKI